MSADAVKLTALNEREAIADGLSRCLRGFDSGNKELFQSGCLQTEQMTLVAGPNNLQGYEAVNKFCERLFVLVTSHITSNIRIEVQAGADTAHLTCNSLNFHIRPEDAFVPEDKSYTASTLYDLDMVKDKDGLWKIKKWHIKLLWTTGDGKVLHDH